MIVTPYNYQKPVISAVKTALKTKMTALFVMATGLGKTIVSALIVRDRLKRGEKGLFLCHETGILEQAEGEYRKVIGNNLSYKTFYGQSTKDWTADTADMLFASFQSLNNWHEKWYIAFEPDHFDFMVVDESHHGQAPTYKEVIDYFNCKKVGMTATPDRMDKKEIREIFGKEVAEITLEEGIANGWLAGVEYHVLSDGISTQKLKKICKGVLEEGQKISVKQLNETIFVKARDQEEAEIIKSYSQGKKTMIFCESIDHADNFKQYLDNVCVSHSKLGEEENRQARYDFREGKAQYILTVDKFNEGIDVPDTEVVVFLRATDSKTIFFHQLGRGLRKTALKNKVIVLDFVANCDRLIMIEELADRIKKYRPPIGVEKNRFDVSGDTFDFIFHDELRDVLELIILLKKGFYKTWQEASEACIRAGVKGEKDYSKRYRTIDMRLPSRPSDVYHDFPGFAVFLGKEIAPKDWMTAKGLSREVDAGEKAIKSYSQKYCHDHPEWFKEFFTGSFYAEHYHPKLVRIIREKLSRKFAPKDWMTANTLKKELRVTDRTVKSFVETYRHDHLEWFKEFWTGNKNVEHYHPKLVRIIREKLSRKFAPKDWMTTSMLKQEVKARRETILSLIDNYRRDHPEWFKEFWAGQQYTEHLHPKLVRIIREKLSREFAPKDWMTGSAVARKLSVAVQTVKSFTKEYCHSHPQWFKEFWTGYQHAEHYHPKLVRIIREKLSRKFAPKDWMTTNVLSKETGAGWGTIKSLVETYRHDHLEWFKEFWTGQQYTEHLHPKLVRIIRTELKKRRKGC